MTALQRQENMEADNCMSPVGRIVCASRQGVIVLASVRFLRLATNQKHAQLDVLVHRGKTIVRTNEVHVLPTGVK